MYVRCVCVCKEAAVAPKNTAKATEAVEPIKGAAVDGEPKVLASKAETASTTQIYI